jgi:hypothetical protein
MASISHNKSALQVFGWDVTPDGKKFLIDTATMLPEPVTVVLNWTARGTKIERMSLAAAINENGFGCLPVISSG